MKTKKSAYGIEFVTQNKFSKYLNNVDDRKLNKFLRIKYQIVTKMHLQKLVQKESWFRTMNDHWCDILSDAQKSYIDKQITLGLSDLKLERIVCYDLIPKECLRDYRNKYFGFKKAFVKKRLFDRRPLEIKDAFDKMLNSYGEGSWYNVDQFQIKEDSTLGRVFDYFTIETIGLTKSFYIIKYTLYVNDNANTFLERLLKEQVYRSAFCISDGKWWRKKSFAGCSDYNIFPNDAKRHAVNDYIMELKSVFFKELKSKLLTKFYNWKTIIPSIEIYSSQTLETKHDSICSLLELNSHVFVEKFNEEEIYFIPFGEHADGKDRINSSKIIANTTAFEAKDLNSPRIDHINEIICQNFADYFVLSSLSAQVTNAVYDSQLKINYSVYHQLRLDSLMRSKSKIDRSLYFYRRLYKELCDHKISQIKEKEEYYLGYFTNTANMTSTNATFLHGFEYTYDFMFGKIKTQSELIESMYSHFDENSKLVESRYNYKIVKWTLIVSAITLFVTILLANNSAIICKIIELFK